MRSPVHRGAPDRVRRPTVAVIALSLAGLVNGPRSSRQWLHNGPAYQSAMVTLPGHWTGEFLPMWEKLPDRAEGLRAARAKGLFEQGGAETMQATEQLSDDETMWTKEYAEDGNYKFWSLGQPKKEFVELLKEASYPASGLSAAVLGCGLGVEADYLARQAASSSETGMHAVAGVDIAATAIKKAAAAFGSTAGLEFYHMDVCKLPAPTIPLDVIVDNTVFQNMDAEQLPGYLDALRRISTPGHTALHLNLMSEEGIAKRYSEFKSCFDYVNLPLVRKRHILDAFSADWDVLEIREGVYDLRPEAAGFECQAFYDYGGADTPGIPSWWLILRRKSSV
eukprot:TRINITY_DN65840_c0_g1_i1.p1 TRINITY_DN65840_c0_g1~~TRINITY_DN65840_c0_g1_i1.p1  ORF type:complete len:337 (+),score=55.45 TRINITY_DN65840_c0_g1_i1:112-1122(+)